MHVRPHVLSTRLTPYKPARAYLQRPRVTAALQRALDYPLTIVRAGAGYGKSTALAALTDTGYPLAWYQLDNDDKDLQVFLLYLITGVARAMSISDQPLALLEARDSAGAPLPWGQVVDALINEITLASDGPVLLVLDDAHHLRQIPQASAVLDRLLTYGPANLRLVLATRHTLELDSLVSLRARGEVLELTADDLAFTVDEISAYFGDLPLSRGQAQQLAAETEGWAIALQLVRQRLTYADVQQPPLPPVSLSGQKQDLFTYLAQEVFDKQPAEIQDFLRVTACLHQMTPALCDELRGSSDSEAIIQHLLHTGLFIVALEPPWTRYRHLFREFLYHRLSPDERAAAHRRALAVHLARNEPEDAIAHALQAGAWAQAAGLIRESGRSMVLAGRLETLAGWLDRFPPETLRAHPALLINLGDIARLHSRFTEALSWYKQAEEQCQAQGDVQGQARALRGQARVYLDTVNPSGAEPALQAALRLSDGQDDREAHANLLDLLAENQLNRGRIDEAEVLRQQATALRLAGPGTAELDVRVLLRTGRLDDAQAILEDRATAEREEPVLRPRAHRETLLLLSLIQAFKGQAGAALQSALEGTERGQQLDSPFITAVGHMRQGHALLLGEAPDRLAQAEALFSRAMAISDQLDVPRLKPEACWGLCRVYGVQGELERAEDAMVQGMAIAENAGDEWMIAQLRNAVGIAWTLAGEHERAIAALQQAATGFNECGDLRSETTARLWLCLNWQSRGDEIRLTHSLVLALHNIDQYGWDDLLTHRTIMGPPDPRVLVPLLLFARQREIALPLVERVLNALGLARIETHPGYQLRVQTLGAFDVWRGATPVAPEDWKRSTARQLFQLFLTWHGGLYDREKLCATLWPDASPATANQRFKVALNALYQALEPDRESGMPSAYIIRENSRYGLRPEADLAVDSLQFERLIAQGNAEYHRNPDNSLAPYLEALELYGGDYLEEALYDEWLAGKRRQLRSFCLQAGDRVARVQFNRGEWDAAIDTCQRILARDLCWERAYRLMMSSYVELGMRPMALRTYQQAVECLRDELDVSPSDETTRLYERILRSSAS